jgi:prevent-host-death family protein
VEHRISATQLARRLGSVLGRVRYRGDSFLVERNGEPVARVLPVASASLTSLAEALGAWREAGEQEAEFAAVLDRIGELDRPPADPWAS